MGPLIHSFSLTELLGSHITSDLTMHLTQNTRTGPQCLTLLLLRQAVRQSRATQEFLGIMSRLGVLSLA